MRGKIETAKKRATESTKTDSFIDEGSWKRLAVRCPICDNNAILEGWSEPKFEESTDGKRIPVTLEFFAISFFCPQCELDLNDSDELEFANIPTRLDRADKLEKFLDDWMYYDWYEKHQDWYEDQDSVEW